MESVVTLSVGDAGELLTLQRAAYVTEAQAHNDLGLPPLIQSLDELTTELAKPEVTAFGLRDDAQRLVAAVRVYLFPAEPFTAELGRLVVAPDMQGRGRGSRLLELVEERLPEQVTDLRLFTGERSLGNLRLYSRFGYQETHRTPTPGGYALVHLTKRVR
ncbi:ribosomal protein S18 acetylase RimI-like enzyme [Mycobacterium frederiksbergense]|uniref:Ribosomal protein S18 acetylase RimI-like enzyme n=1 Tax=Mycolicibacterium frederiksbergense TaxID=117567 RepID=A0ABT6L7V2_9MYCO|nr:GNAT family N-acetyltransferase [Mycolicibacterium frederiksbergense]MDH6199034.1 ribosomal protein S18 acetylase RimI-like enzyme [Mycolicibacterium frederiksbergense]